MQPIASFLSSPKTVFYPILEVSFCYAAISLACLDHNVRSSSYHLLNLFGLVCLQFRSAQMLLERP